MWICSLTLTVKRSSPIKTLICSLALLYNLEFFSILCREFKGNGSSLIKMWICSLILTVKSYSPIKT
jgi:hypothetical protein